MTDKEKEKHIKWLDKKIAKAKISRKRYTKDRDKNLWCLIRGREIAYIEMKKRVKNS